MTFDLKKGKSDLQRYPLILLMILNKKDIVVFLAWKVLNVYPLILQKKCVNQFFRKTEIKNNNFLMKKIYHEYPIQHWSGKAFEGTVVHRTWHSINRESLNTTITVSLLDKRFWFKKMKFVSNNNYLYLNRWK